MLKLQFYIDEAKQGHLGGFAVNPNVNYGRRWIAKVKDLNIPKMKAQGEACEINWRLASIDNAKLLCWLLDEHILN